MPRKVIVTHPGCGACKAIKERLKDEFSNGTLQEMPVTTKEGYEIAKKLGLQAVPQCVEINDDGTYGFCSINEILEKKDVKETPVMESAEIGEDTADVQ